MRAKEFLIEGYKEVTQKYASAGADPTKVSNAITAFKEIVNKNQVKGDERNIDWWGKHKSFAEFSKFVKSFDLARTKTQVTRKKVVGNSINLIDNDNWLVVIPLDKEASCFHGKNSDWCTTKTNKKHFEEYFSKGTTLIYCLNKKTGGMWAIAAGATGKMELFDQADKSLTKVEFKQQTGMNPTQLVTLATKHKKPIQDARTKAAMQDPGYAYNYARDVIGGRWPEAEKVIASDPEYAYRYARDVIGGRWFEMEEKLVTDPESAYLYAMYVIRGRWPEAEKVIASDPVYAYLYARDVIRGRWPEAEKVIASDSEFAYASAYEYARDVIGDSDPNTWRKRYLAGEIK
jgi:hypothetical protein